MARLPRLVVPNHLHHVVVRGNNEQPVFHDEEDYRQFLLWLREAAQQCQVAIHAYALLPGRFHLLTTPADEPGLGRMMQTVGRHYVPWFNARHGRSGSLWEGRFRATVMDAADYFCACTHWIEYQPVLAGLAPDMAVYPWSSHAHHLGLRKQVWLKDHSVYWSLGNTPFDREAAFQQLCAVPPDPRVADAIEAATRKAWVLGGEAFKVSLAKLTGRRLQPARRGRPPRRAEALPVTDQPAPTLPTLTTESKESVRTRGRRRRDMPAG
jgi:putative transposase